MHIICTTGLRQLLQQIWESSILGNHFFSLHHIHLHMYVYLAGLEPALGKLCVPSPARQATNATHTYDKTKCNAFFVSKPMWKAMLETK